MKIKEKIIVEHITNDELVKRFFSKPSTPFFWKPFNPASYSEFPKFDIKIKAPILDNFISFLYIPKKASIAPTNAYKLVTWPGDSLVLFIIISPIKQKVPTTKKEYNTLILIHQL